jgi:hypothetical protein
MVVSKMPAAEVLDYLPSTTPSRASTAAWYGGPTVVTPTQGYLGNRGLATTSFWPAYSQLEDVEAISLPIGPATTALPVGYVRL